MTPRVKMHLTSAIYCSILVGLNWFREVKFTREMGTREESVSPVALAVVASAAVAFYLAFQCLKTARLRLERGDGISSGKWIESWSVLWYVCPLLWHRQSISSWREPDGAIASLTQGFGHPLSVWVLLYAVIGLLLFQILARLNGDGDTNPQLAARNQLDDRINNV